MPRRDDEGSIVAFNTFELAASFYDLLGGSINAASGLVEVEGGGAHDVNYLLSTICGFISCWNHCL